MSIPGSAVKRSRALSIRAYLSLMTAAITGPLLLLLAVLLIRTASEQRIQLESRVTGALESLVNEIDRQLDRDFTILRTLATSNALAAEDWPAFYDQAKGALQGRSYLVLVDAAGRQLVNTFVPYGKQPPLTGDPETVQRMVETRSPVVSNYFVSLVVRKPVFNVSIPVLKEGQVRFVMSLGLLPEDLAAMLTARNFEPEWVASIWDAKGVILARSRDHARLVGTLLPDRLSSQEPGRVARTANLDGIDVLNASARSRVSGWGVGLNVPYSLITKPMRDSMLLWGVSALGAAILAILLGTFVARQVTRSLSEAADAAAAFGRDEAFPLGRSRLREAEALLAALRSAHEIRGESEATAKQAKADLARANASLEDTVQERTTKLREMVDELQHLSYSITHDMRAPLRAMSSFSDLLIASAENLSPECRDYCRRIQTGAARLDRLIQDALNYSRAVLQDLPLEPVPLSRLVRGLLDTYPNFHPDKADVRIEGRLPTVLGNEALLTQCLSNLIGNAVKFVPPGKRPSVRIRAESGNGACKVWIEDDGIGIPKHAQHRLFGMFQKLDNQYEGTGIGLAIVRKVVERMGGQVGVESEPGKGSRFWVVLRCAPD